MKQIGFLCLFLFMTAGLAVAQQGGQGRSFSADDMAKMQTEQMREHVKMTKDVEKKVHDLNLKYAKKSQELRGGSNMMNMSDSDREKMRSQMQLQQEEKDKEMKKLLSADQYKSYENYRKEASQRMRGPGNR